MDKYLIHAKIRLEKVKEAMRETLHNFIHEEKGAAEILAVIILVVIVVLLAVAFRKQLGDFVQKLWDSITGQADEVTKEF